MKQQFSIQGMSCNHCVAKVEETLQTLPGVQKVKVNLKKRRAWSNSTKVKFNQTKSKKKLQH